MPHALKDDALYVAEVTMSAQRALHAYMIEKIANPEAKKKVFLFLYNLMQCLQACRRGCHIKKC